MPWSDSRLNAKKRNVSARRRSKSNKRGAEPLKRPLAESKKRSCALELKRKNNNARSKRRKEPRKPQKWPNGSKIRLRKGRQSEPNVKNESVRIRSNLSESERLESAVKRNKRSSKRFNSNCPRFRRQSH